MVQATGYPDLKDQIYKSYDEQLQLQKRHPLGPNPSSGGESEI
jgi:hypothetical protein